MREIAHREMPTGETRRLGISHSGALMAVTPTRENAQLKRDDKEPAMEREVLKRCMVL
ncbi:hypothetical protein [Streptomyces prasinus]|uniref:hypothetical protein n=1 Tax=Streptomyces prasinus TaxID=67345 RepID=UPI0033BAC408